MSTGIILDTRKVRGVLPGNTQDGSAHTFLYARNLEKEESLFISISEGTFWSKTRWQLLYNW